MENKQEKLIEKSIRTHGDKYDYSKVKYVNNCINVIILCKKHNFEFNQKPDNHIRVGNCPKCSLQERSNKTKNNISRIIYLYNIILVINN